MTKRPRSRPVAAPCGAFIDPAGWAAHQAVCGPCGAVPF